MPDNEGARINPTPRRQIGRWLTITTLAVLAAAGGGWAAATVLAPADDVLKGTAFTYVEVAHGEIGSNINLNTVAEWTSNPVGWNLATGTVTTIGITAGQEVSQGAVLYTVDLRPVVIAEGAIPAFATMSTGSTGADVAQLQRLLTDLGLFGGKIDGEFDWLTREAVRDWQESLGLKRDGVVQAGDIIFVPSLPARVALDGAIVARGLPLGGGEKVVNALAESPHFAIPATILQAALMPTGTRVEVTAPDGASWQGFVMDQRPAEDGTVAVSLGGQDGATICGEQCGTIPVTDRVLLPSKVVTVEAVEGLTVPSAALLTKPNGSIIVTDDQGREHPITVTASARGMSVVVGVDAGVMVRVPASAG